MHACEWRKVYYDKVLHFLSAVEMGNYCNGLLFSNISTGSQIYSEYISITNKLKFVILFRFSLEIICDSGLKNTEYEKTEALLGFSSGSINICHSFKSLDLSSKIQT